MFLFIEKDTALVLEGLNSNNHFFHLLILNTEVMTQANSISFKYLHVDACSEEGM